MRNDLNSSFEHLNLLIDGPSTSHGIQLRSAQKRKNDFSDVPGNMAKIPKITKKSKIGDSDGVGAVNMKRKLMEVGEDLFIKKIKKN